MMVSISLTTDTSVSSMVFDLAFATNYLSSAPPILGAALSDHIVVSSEPSPGVRRVQISSFSAAPLSSGVLVYLPFSIATNAPDHDTVLSLTNVSNPVVADQAGGVLAISPRPGFTSIARMTDGVVRLQMSGSDTRTYVIETATNFSANSWISVATNSPVNGTILFEDIGAGESQTRFYRAILAR
ncbi:MAG: hypothetical protein H7X97_06790 [Opitutaceae bacterium]|nr:hypothetical protein [Verrucomicrobiales bacterium]